MEESLRDAVEQAIGYRFTRAELLELALRHASIAEVRSQSNERLEFLGDAVLGMVVCEMIYQRFPELLEGEMTKIKSAVVSRRVCADIARDLGLDERLTLGKGMQGHHQLPQSLAAAVLESIIAAIYLDGGYAAATNFINTQFKRMIEEAYSSGHQQNFKSLLQQHAQQSMSLPPVYRILDEKGPDHAKCFKVAVEVAGRRFESAWGPNKKQAEQQAALNALQALGVITEGDAGQPVLAPDGVAK